MKKKVFGCVGIVLGVSLLANLFFLSRGIFGGEAGVPGFEEVVVEEGNEEKIAHIDLSGFITTLGSGVTGKSTVERMKRAVRQAAEDDAVKAIVLRVSSPGGEVTASDVIYDAVRKLNEVKPVVVYMDTVAASGGYYIACGAKQIVASETTITGSIGVIMQTMNYEALFEKAGLESVVFTSGAFKDTLSGSREMRDDEREYIQKMVTDMYDRFVKIVSRARGIPVSELKNGVADGRVLLAPDAEEAGLVDQIGYVEDAYALARQEGGVPEAQVVRYVPRSTFGGLLGILAKSAERGNTIEIDVSDRLVPRLEPGQAYFLPTHYRSTP